MKRKVLDELRKSLSETDITGKLVQPQINRVIQSLILVNAPLRANLPRKPGSGEAALINQRTANPAAETVADTTDFTAKESTYGARQSFTFKTVGVRGQVTRKAQAIGRTYTDIKAQEMQACLDAVRDKEESLIVGGDATANATQFSGFRKIMADTSSQIVTAGTNGAPLTLAMLDEAIDRCYGVPNMIVCSKRTRRELNALLQVNQRFVDRMEVNGGFKVMSYNDIPIFWSQHISDAQNQGTSNVASDLFVIDTTRTWIEVLTELRMEPLAKKSSQYDEFDVYMDEVLVIANPKYNAHIKGIIPPA